MGLICMQRIVTFRNFLIAVGLCLIASASMALAPVVRSTKPLLPFLGMNWLLWMVVAGVFRRSNAEWITYDESVWWERLTSLVLVSFTLAGFFALLNAESLMQTGDVARLR